MKKNIKLDNEVELLTVQHFAELLDVSVQAIYKRLNNSLKKYVKHVEGRIMLDKSALYEVYKIGNEQNSNDTKLNVEQVFDTEDYKSEILFLRTQVEKLQKELELERQHNREKDKQLLETFSKLAESQKSLIDGQTADKQKELAETIIEGKHHIEENLGDFDDKKDKVDENVKFFWKTLFKKN